MKRRMYHPSDGELAELRRAIEGVFACPFVDDIEDYIWEAIFAAIKGIPLVDPLSNTRKKQLFDLVDPKSQTGWSAKALQWTIKPGAYFELVIQRADIFRKASTLGFGELSAESRPSTLGRALIKHWRAKFELDSESQVVKHPRVCILLKNKTRTRYALYEADFHIHPAESLEWEWTNDQKLGLQAKIGDTVVYRWYRGQKQFFERFQLPPDTKVLQLTPRRLPMDVVFGVLADRLSKQK